jgi:hypothetical protein
MPIRINLLAEHQAAEEERRKDPVKRTVIVAAMMVGLVALWAALLQVKVIAASRHVGALQSQWKSIEKSYELAVATQRKNLEADERLAALRNMSTNRFLWGNALNAFQQTLNHIDDVQVVRMKIEQNYAVTEATPNRTNGTTVMRGKPGTATEKVLLTIDAMDSSPQAGSRIAGFKDAISGQPYFQRHLAKTNGLVLISRSAPQLNQGSQNQFVMFTLQCLFPEKVR